MDKIRKISHFESVPIVVRVSPEMKLKLIRIKKDKNLTLSELVRDIFDDSFKK